ncbi:phage portal protein [Liquorilactobacillus vini]|uniref:phage portal protein n=1 Tax=Liquorilactobacillus vini TaxID=238015 RepID=UPI0002E8702F|nr:phage portal protein [Liquorilactobacillus vini]
MPIFNFARSSTAAFTVSDDSDVINFLKSNGNQYVNADTALQNSDIYSIVMQLSGDLATVKYKANMPRAQGIIDNPSATANGHAFWQSMFAQLMLAGECFAYRWRNNNGVDLRWEYLRPSQVSTYLLEDGSGLVYTVAFDEPEIGVKENVPQSDMIHMRLLSKTGGMTGVSPLSALVNELSIKDASNDLTISALKQSIISPGVLSVKHGSLLDWKMKSARSRQFMKQISSSNNGPIVIDDGENYTPLEIKSNVATLLNQVDWTSTQIAKVFGVPDSYLNGQGDQQSSLTMIKGMYANALNRYVEAIVGELNNKLSAEITADIRPAIDPLGDDFASTLSGLAKDGTIANNQAIWMLQNAGYLPADMPDAEKQPVQQVVIQPTKGGESENDNSTNQGSDQ